MPLDAQLVAHLGDALGPGFSTVMESITNTPSGGISAIKARKPRKHPKRRSMSGGKSPSKKRYGKFEYDPTTKQLSYRRLSSKPRSRKSRFSRLRGGQIQPQSQNDDLLGGKKSSKWIRHVKSYARKHNISYGAAMKAARSSYSP
jgi:hypothetical protein